jgi:hypothetical protein
MGSIIEIGTIKDVEPWAQLRIALWPHHSLEDHCAELARSFFQEMEKQPRSSLEMMRMKLSGLQRPLYVMIT